MNFQFHFRIFLAAPHLQLVTRFIKSEIKIKKNGEVHKRSPAKYTNQILKVFEATRI